MVYQLEIREQARTGIIDGFLWYEEKSSGLGVRFVDAVEAVICYVAENPFHFQVKFRDYREALIRPFPYVVIYQVADNVITVSAVFPCRTDPEKKPK